MAVENVIKTVFTVVDHATKTLLKIQTSITASVQRTARAVEAANKKLTGFEQSFRRAFMYVAGASVGVFYGINRLTSSMGSLVETSDRLGFPVESLQEWGYVAKQVGVSTEEFESRIQKFVKGFALAQASMGPMTATLKKIDPALLKTMRSTGDVSKAFDLYIKAMQSTTNPSKRAALAVAAFGKEGLSMLGIANQTPEALKQLREEMRSNGLITEEQARLADSYGDTLNKLKMTLFSVAGQALTPLLPLLMLISNRLRDWIKANKDLIASKLREFVNFITTRSGDILLWAQRIGKLIAAFYALVAAVKIANVVMQAFNLATRINPVFAIVSGFMAAIAIIWQFRDEIDYWAAYFFDWCREIGAAFSNLWTSASAFFTRTWENLKVSFSSVWDSILISFTAVWDTIKAIVSSVVDVLRGDFDAVAIHWADTTDKVQQGFAKIASSRMESTKALAGSVKEMVKQDINLALVGTLKTAAPNTVRNVADVYKADFRPFESRSTIDSTTNNTVINNFKESGAVRNFGGYGGGGGGDGGGRKTIIDQTALSRLPKTPAVKHIYEGFLKDEKLVKQAPNLSTPSAMPSPPSVPREIVTMSDTFRKEESVEKTNIEKSEVTIVFDAKGQAKVTKGKLPQGLKLVHTGAM